MRRAASVKCRSPGNWSFLIRGRATGTRQAHGAVEEVAADRQVGSRVCAVRADPAAEYQKYSLNPNCRSRDSKAEPMTPNVPLLQEEPGSTAVQLFPGRVKFV